MRSRRTRTTTIARGRVALWTLSILCTLPLLPSAVHAQRGNAQGADGRPRPGRPGTADRRAAAPLTTFDVVETSIPDLQAAMTAGRVTSRELTAAYLARIEAYDRQGPRINAVILANPHALDDAAALDQERKTKGPRGPLHGIPLVVKDNFETADMPTTAGSLALAGMETKRDAFQVRKLRDAGAVIVAKTNLHELASGITTISSLGGQTLNPYDLARTPGGSSGGTGAAVAASLAAAGLGSDTCGSIRIPAAHNNLFGLRGTLGLSSRGGIVPLSHTQDVGGPLARTVTDLALVLDATVGVDPDDPITREGAAAIPASYRDALTTGALKGARLGLLESLFGDAQEDREVAALVRKAVGALEQEGAETIAVAVPGLDDLLRDATVINYEFKFDLLDFLATRPAPVRSVDDILASGRYHASLDTGLKTRNKVESRDTDGYRRALVKRGAIRQMVLSTLDEHRLDALVYPTLRRKPALVGDAQLGSNCQLSATSGLPAISVPAGFTDDGLPVGMDFLGRAYSEARLLALAYGHEQLAHPRRAPFSTPPLVDGSRPQALSFTVTARPEREVSRARDATSAPSADRASPTSTAAFVFERTTGRLRYDVATTSGFGAAAIVTLHRGAAGANGPVIARLLDAPAGAGEVTLNAADAAALLDGALYLAVSSTTGSDVRLRGQVTATPRH